MAGCVVSHNVLKKVAVKTYKIELKTGAYVCNDTVL